MVSQRRAQREGGLPPRRGMVTSFFATRSQSHDPEKTVAEKGSARVPFGPGPERSACRRQTMRRARAWRAGLHWASTRKAECTFSPKGVGRAMGRTDGRRACRAVAHTGAEKERRREQSLFAVARNVSPCEGNKVNRQPRARIGPDSLPVSIQVHKVFLFPLVMQIKCAKFVSPPAHATEHEKGPGEDVRTATRDPWRDVSVRAV